MISLRLEPVAARRAAYSRVRASWMSLLTAIVHSALFSARLSLWRWVLPLECSTGLTPHNAANAASPLSILGSSPAVTRSWAAQIGPMPGQWRAP